jgi:6,7-dimethyl-8-ribityllumazine synthase
MSEINTLKPDRDISIAIVASRFNGEITKSLYQAAVDRLVKSGVAKDNILSVWVPGCVEIPFLVQRCASSTLFDAVIAIGAVIRGETAHFDYVAKQVSDGCQQIALECDVPVIFGVLTTENLQQAKDRSGSKGNSGTEWADAALCMIATADALDDIIEPILESELMEELEDFDDDDDEEEEDEDSEDEEEDEEEENTAKVSGH